ncbi:MAG: nitrite/sulfite reductase [Deltaproteobacteria bacterium]|nr:nitrite/sulfite reductase [Deltaproteobacteria bacterium]
MATWKSALAGAISEPLAEEIDGFETQMILRRQGALDEAVFAELRLRRGVYGQRYDNGRRHDGLVSRSLDFPSGETTKGPGTYWDAPGMMRLKIPGGLLSAEQLEVLAELAEEYADGVLHVTTRQDIQFHFVHIEDTPDLMRRLGAVGISTREACGNSVRNITACPISGVCADEAFDVTPYAQGLNAYLLGHQAVQDFGRKFKISFSGCGGSACALANIHDIGFVAATREVDGQTRRGFRAYVGGGLGAVPHSAQLLSEFVDEQELLPLTHAICLLFAEHGEKRNRARARLKFVVAKFGIDRFREMVAEKRQTLADDPRWSTYLAPFVEQPVASQAPGAASGASRGTALSHWQQTNVRRQRQSGYSTVTVALPLGDFTGDQSRALADIARSYLDGTVRLTVEQNIVLRWVSDADLATLYAQLADAGLAQPGAETIADITSCPGTDTCKLGISSSRGLAAELRSRYLARTLDPAIAALRVKVSGCFNSCGQHHIADIGFYGVSRKLNGYTVPHFQLVIGGKWAENGGAYGLAIGAIPSKNVPHALSMVLDHYATARAEQESFHDFVRRVGKAELKTLIAPTTVVPSYFEDRSFYSDWGDPREYTTGDMGQGECAGEVISPVQFGLAESEKEAFSAQLALDAGQAEQAAQAAYRAMLAAANALLRGKQLIVEEAEQIVDNFRRLFIDTELFFDPYAGGKFANYLLTAHDARDELPSLDSARRRVEEAQLFIEAAHACHGRM